MLPHRLLALVMEGQVGSTVSVSGRPKACWEYSSLGPGCHTIKPHTRSAVMRAVELAERACLEIPRESLIEEVERGGEKARPSVQAWPWLERAASICLGGQHPEEVVLGQQLDRCPRRRQLGGLDHLR